MRAALLAWYARHRRDLPWRDTTDPYAVWVSEVMLQQTRVDTARPYYERWMAALPTLADLAAADPGTVLGLWQGLGYYARARHLHQAARAVMARNGGQMPRTAAELAALPGLGPYAAGAIASIAFGEAVPAVDGNVTRVISRLAALDGDPRAAAHGRAIAAVATGLVAGEAPGDVNQALMELGATVCTPVAPACGLCPVAAWCAAYGTGRQAELPRRRPRARPRPEHWYAYVLGESQAGTVLVAQRPAAGLLGGLWTFPMLPADPSVDPVDLAAAELGLRVGVVRRLPAVGHVFSHIRLTATPIVATLREGVATVPGYVTWRRVTPAELDQLPMSTLMAKLCRVAGLVAGPPRARGTKHEAAGLPPAAPKDLAEAG